MKQEPLATRSKEEYYLLDDDLLRLIAYRNNLDIEWKMPCYTQYESNKLYAESRRITRFINNHIINQELKIA